MLLVLLALGLVSAGRVRYDDLKALHFKRGFTIRGHRGASGLQMVCTGGAVELEPRVRGAACERTGTAWTCTLDADDAVLSEPSVTCIPWAGNDDEYVAEGSCTLRYKIHHAPVAPPARGAAEASEPLRDAVPANIFAMVIIPVLCVGAGLFVFLLLWLDGKGRGRSKYVAHMFCPTVTKRGTHSNCPKCYLYVQRRADDTDPAKSFPYTQEFARTFCGTVARAPSGSYPTPKARRPLMAGDLCTGCKDPARPAQG